MENTTSERATFRHTPAVITELSMILNLHVHRQSARGPFDRWIEVERWGSP